MRTDAPAKKSAAEDPLTLSGIPVRREYGPADLAGKDVAAATGTPGAYPYTRGLKGSGYRVTPWTMRMFAGHKTAKDTNERFKYLLEHGQTGLSTAFDLPTLMGLDSDDPRSLGEVGREGVAVDSLADMEILFSGIDLGKVSTSMTINLPAPVILAMYLALAKKQGVPFKRVRGTCQTDILKEYIAQNEYLYPPSPRCGWCSTSSSTASKKPPLLSHLHLRLPHPRGRRRRGAGARVHARRRARLRRAARQTRLERGRLRLPALLLLRRAQRLLRRDRQAARRAGPRHSVLTANAASLISWMLPISLQTSDAVREHDP